MKIALAQMEVIPGKPQKNLETMLRMIAEAKEQHVDLVAFPELCVSGYLVGDKWTEDAFCEQMMQFNVPLLEASRGIALAYGNIFLDTEINARVGDHNIHPNKDGRTRKYNAVYIMQNGRMAPRRKPTPLLPDGVQPKGLLPNYRFFDDERYFFALEDIAKDFAVPLESLAQPFLIDVRGVMMPVPIGVEVCEDLWCEDYRRAGEAQDITKLLIKNGAQRIINLSASPWTYGKNSARDRRIEFLRNNSGDSFVPFLYVNCVGAQDNGKGIITFDGGSTAYNREGKPIALADEPYAEQLLIVNEHDLKAKPVQRKEKPRIAQKLDALIVGMRHLKNLRGREEYPVIINGMSGGLDSSITSALAVIAFGKERVIGVNMPWQYSSGETIGAAEQTANALGIRYVDAPIFDIVQTMLSAANTAAHKTGAEELNALQRGNLAAKARMTVLSNLAAAHGGIYLNNGNKDEVAIGYFTLDGDGRGAIAPLGDVTKYEEFELARHLNDVIFREEVIPWKLIPDELCRWDGKIEPSAELEEGQRDPIKFGYHCALIDLMLDYQKKTEQEILELYRNGTLHRRLAERFERSEEWGLAIMERYGLEEPTTFITDLEWLIPKIDASVFKRVQGPPNILTSKTAFGYDLRESILPPEEEPTQTRELKENIRQRGKYQSR